MRGAAVHGGAEFLLSILWETVWDPRENYPAKREGSRGIHPPTGF